MCENLGEMETTARVLALLSALQRRPRWSGPELAERLGVTVRTVRRDVELGTGHRTVVTHPAMYLLSLYLIEVTRAAFKSGW